MHNHNLQNLPISILQMSLYKNECVSSIQLQFFSILIINSQMAFNHKKSGQSRSKTHILISNNSELFPQAPGNMLFGRSSSRNQPDFINVNSNLFQNFYDPERDRERETRQRNEHPRRHEIMDESQKYAHQCLEYQKYIFDDKVRFIIHRMSILAYNTCKEKTDNVFLTFFIERMLCVLAKKLLLNKFQLFFLEYVFEESKWKYDIELISSFADQFKSFVHIYQSQSPHGFIKNLQIYLLFCSYYSKKSLNQMVNDGVFNIFLKGINQKFKERYQDWAEISGVTKIRINPKLLNLIYKKLTSFQEKEKDYFQNYNLIVEEILQISPAYNADKQKRGKKKRKIEEAAQNNRQLESYQIQQPIPMNAFPEESPQLPSVTFRKKQTSYVSNVDGLDPVAYYNRNP